MVPASRLRSSLGLLLLAGLTANASITQAGLDRYRELVVADVNQPGLATRNDGIRVTYLGVNGYQFEADGHALLIDPYFTRAGLWAVATGATISPKIDRVRAGLAHVRPRVDAVLITHGHFDHLLDVPLVLEKTGAKLLAGPT